MTPSHAIKKGTRYRYYVSRPLITNKQTESSAGLRIAAVEIEQLVQWATAAAAMKSYSDAGKRCGRACSIDRMVQDVRPPNRAGGGRDGEAVRARDHRHRLVEAARLLPMR